MTTTDARTPLELYGTSPGISVIDPSTALTRLWFFDGKFLRAEGFRLEQAYLRALVSLSNRATGHGVVHGFDVRRAGGDRIAVEGGLALARSGRVVHLPSDVELSVSELVERSSGGGPRDLAAAGRADFGRCDPDVTDDDGTVVVAPRPLYVLTVAVAEALCGEEESFGQLCEGACVTETDRETAVEGVRFRVRELRLALPVSSRVPFDERHLRSQVATAYFAREAQEVAPAVSGAGLASGLWCDGAEAVDGEEVPLAVLGRTGAGTVWLDMWTARREIAESSPRRYWEHRLAMRPTDTFLAHVLQFQCQLRDTPATGPGGGGVDPCADERAALAEADHVLGALLEPAEARDRDGGDVRIDASRLSTITARLDELRGRISGVLAGTVASPSGALLVDRGHVTLPPGGYLPVTPSRPVEDQVRALMGPGVDLRFCAVRPDFVPEALWEVQHMERISLTRGIDDPARREEVDVLVPGAEVRESGVGTAAFEGLLRLLPAVRDEDGEPTEGSALTLAAVARDQVQDGWSWSLAAHGEAPQRLAVGTLFGAAVAGAGFGKRAEEAEEGGEEPPSDDGDTTAATGEAVKIYIERDRVHATTLATAAFRQRVNREAVLARERLERALTPGLAVPTTEVTPDRPLPRDEKRPMALWFDVEVDDDLREVAVGGRTAARLRLTSYSRSSDEPALVDARMLGSLVVRSRQTISVSGSHVLDIRTDLEGTIDLVAVSGGRTVDPPPRPVRGTTLRWLVGHSPSGARILSVEPEQADGVRLRATFEDTGTPRHVRGVLAGTSSGIDLGEWQPRTAAAVVGPTLRRLADLELDEVPGALDVGSGGRDLGEAVIGVIGSELAVRNLDPSFGTVARSRLFGDGAAPTQSLTATADWVMFHRRRTRTCAGAAPAPPATRRFRWLHATLDSEDQLERFGRLAGSWEAVRRAGSRGDLDALKVRERVAGLGFEPVTTVEFTQGRVDPASSPTVIRAAWGAADRGARLRLGVVASTPGREGVGVDLARLTATTSIVSDLVDTSAMTTSTLSEIPPEFQTVGIDGVFLTVGVRRSTARLLQARVVRVRDIPPYLRQADGEPITRERLERTFAGIDDFVSVWEDTTWVNRDDVVHWWGGSAVKHAVAVFSERLVEAGLDQDAGERADELGGELGFGPVERLARGIWEDDETELLVVLLES